MKKIAAAVYGGSGYGAGELLRLLALHPQVYIAELISANSVGKPAAELHPQLSGVCDLTCSARLDFSCFSSFERSVVFTALPHGVSAGVVRSIFREAAEHNTLIVDLSGDFRLKDPALRSLHYGEGSVDDEEQQSFIFGLTELHRDELAAARRIANPGCLSSACILAAAPLAKLIDPETLIIFDAKTGTSGAGRTPNSCFHHPEAHSNVRAYKIFGHRHEPEISQELEALGARCSLSFVPHVVPSSRGIYVTAYLQLKAAHSNDSLRNIFCSFYANSPFVRVTDAPPELRNVIGSNFCDIAVFARGKQVVVAAALDNLVKGMAGQAIQNMNVACGMPETEGLMQPGLGVI